MWRLVLTTCLLCWSCEGISVTCKNENNHAVDWYIIYKAPNVLDYIFIIPSGQVKKMNSINNANGPLAKTLEPIFRSIRLMEPNFGFISYSDQPPGSRANDMFGHSKGVLMVDKMGTGVWLLHSTPQFPYRRDRNNFWPPSGKKNAQIFICVTFKYEEFEAIGKHLQYIGAFPFEHDIPDNFHKELKDAVQWNKLSPPTSGFPTIKSDEGTTFKAIPKQQADNVEVGDLYFTIAKEVRSNVFVQVWGQQQDESYCERGTAVLNIETIETALGRWEPKADHSKWCVSQDQNRPWVCIADVNRCWTQYNRLGGALCVQSEKMQEIFQRFAKKHDNCPTRKRPHQCDSDSDSDSLAMTRTAFIMPDVDLDSLNEMDPGVIVDYDTKSLNETEVDILKDPSVMG